MQHVVQPRGGNAAALDVLLQLRAEKSIGGLFHIEPGIGGLHSGVRATPIGDDEALKSPLLLQNVIQQVAILAGIVAIHLVVRTHHRTDSARLDRDLES